VVCGFPLWLYFCSHSLCDSIDTKWRCTVSQPAFKLEFLACSTVSVALAGDPQLRFENTKGPLTFLSHCCVRAVSPNDQPKTQWLDLQRNRAERDFIFICFLGFCCSADGWESGSIWLSASISSFSQRSCKFWIILLGQWSPFTAGGFNCTGIARSRSGMEVKYYLYLLSIFTHMAYWFSGASSDSRNNLQLLIHCKKSTSAHSIGACLFQCQVASKPLLKELFRGVGNFVFDELSEQSLHLRSLQPDSSSSSQNWIWHYCHELFANLVSLKWDVLYQKILLYRLCVRALLNIGLEMLITVLYIFQDRHIPTGAARLRFIDPRLILSPFRTMLQQCKLHRRFL
jgi:hypothetical protein